MRALTERKRTSDSLERSELPVKKARVCINGRKVSLVYMPNEILENIFSYLSIHNLVVCKRINQRICKMIKKSPLLPLAIWKHIPPSVRIFYTGEQYNLRHRDYLTASRGNYLVEKYDDKLKSAAFFSPRLFFDMKQHLITAKKFDCSRKIIYSGCSDDFSLIFSEHSLCLLIEKDPKNKMVLKIVEIDIHGKKETSEITYESKIVKTEICKKSARITTLLEDNYLEFHKLEKGKWLRTLRINCHPYKKLSSNYAFADDYRSLALKSGINTLSIRKEDDEGVWQQRNSIPLSNDYLWSTTFSCDGDCLILQYSKSTQIWKINDQRNYEKRYRIPNYNELFYLNMDRQFLIKTSNFKDSANYLEVFALSGKEVCEKSFTPRPEIYVAQVHISPDNYSTMILSNYKMDPCLIYDKNKTNDKYTRQNLMTELSSCTASFTFSQNGIFFATSKTRTELEIWKKNDKGKWLKQMTTLHKSSIPISFNSNSSCLVTVPRSENSSKQTYFPINVLKLNCEGEWKVKEFFETSPIMKVEWLPDSNHFITILEDGSINQRTIVPIKDKISMTDDAEDMQY